MPKLKQTSSLTDMIAQLALEDKQLNEDEYRRVATEIIAFINGPGRDKFINKFNNDVAFRQTMQDFAGTQCKESLDFIDFINTENGKSKLSAVVLSTLEEDEKSVPPAVIVSLVSIEGIQEHVDFVVASSETLGLAGVVCYSDDEDTDNEQDGDEPLVRVDSKASKLGL